MTTYLFYDVESTGLNRCFDQVIQFAAIRCDKELRELERQQFLVKLNCDVIPHPEALMTHEMGIDTINQGICELTAMEKIHALLNQPGTISLGYNTLNFDDELLRFSFYRNLLPPYTHQYANQCSRMDIYPIVLFYYLFKPEVIQWPQHNGNISLKLENINRENQLASGRAHDAMVDVIVTIELAKRLIQEREMWDYISAGFNKATDRQRLDKLPTAFKSYHIGLLIAGNLGAAMAYQAPVLSLGTHQHYKNQTLWLRLDLPELRQSRVDNVIDNCYVVNKKLGESPFILPMAPRFLHHLSSERQQEVERNLNWLQQNEDIFNAIISYYQNHTYTEIAETDIDAALYNSDFWSPQERAEAEHFHQADAQQKAEAIATMRSPRLIKMATRITGRHFPQQLTSEQQQEFTSYLKKIFSQQPPIDFKGFPRYSLDNAINDINHYRKSATLTEEKQQLLNGLDNYLQTLTQRYQ